MITALVEIKENLESIKQYITTMHILMYASVCINYILKTFFTTKEMNNEIKDLYTQIKELFLCIN